LGILVNNLLCELTTHAHAVSTSWGTRTDTNKAHITNTHEQRTDTYTNCTSHYRADFHSKSLCDTPNKRTNQTSNTHCQAWPADIADCKSTWESNERHSRTTTTNKWRAALTRSARSLPPQHLRPRRADSLPPRRAADGHKFRSRLDPCLCAPAGAFVRCVCPGEWCRAALS
jgi:hypothetical protein